MGKWGIGRVVFDITFEILFSKNFLGVSFFLSIIYKNVDIIVKG